MKKTESVCSEMDEILAEELVYSQIVTQHQDAIRAVMSAITCARERGDPSAIPRGLNAELRRSQSLKSSAQRKQRFAERQRRQEDQILIGLR